MLSLVRLRFVLAVITVLAFSGLYATIVPPLVTYDSWQYLSSGMSIASGRFPDGYFLIREPLYPALVGVLAFTPLGITLLIFAQAMLFSSGLWMVSQTLSRMLGLQGILSTITSIFFVLFSFFFWGGYAAFVGQQVLVFFFFASIFALGERVIRSQTISRFEFFLAAILGVMGALTSAFLLLSWGLFCVFLLGARAFRSKMHAQKLLSLFLLVVVFGGTSLGVWFTARSQIPAFSVQISQEAALSGGVFSPHQALIESGIPAETGFLASFLANLDLLPTQGWGLDQYTSGGGNGTNNFVFGSAQLTAPHLCTVFPEEGVQFVLPEINDQFSNCTNSEISVQRSIPLEAKVMWSIQHLIYFASVVALLLSASRVTPLQLKVVLLYSLTLPITYALLLGGIARYGMPAQIMLFSIAVGLIARAARTYLKARV